MSDNANFQEILDLEQMLLKTEVRSSSAMLSRLIDTSFFEFGSSGKIYRYKQGDIFPPITQKTSIQDFSTVFLSETAVLATYTLVKENETRKEYSRRSSLWKINGAEWKIIFHQGTSIADEGSAAANFSR